jgi:hypothetical protein
MRLWIRTISPILMTIGFILMACNYSPLSLTPCSYGPLKNGCMAYALYWNGSAIPDSTIISHNGSGAIAQFAGMFKNNIEVSRICFIPNPVVQSNESYILNMYIGPMFYLAIVFEMGGIIASATILLHDYQESRIMMAIEETHLYLPK